MLTATDVRNLTSRDTVSYFFRAELGYQVNPVSFDAGEHNEILTRITGVERTYVA